MCSLTLTDYPSIFMVVTVMVAIAIMSALRERRLMAIAPDFIQPDLSTARSKMSHHWSTQGWSTANLSANHFSIRYVPDVIAHSAPGATDLYLHSPRTATAAIHQPHKI